VDEKECPFPCTRTTPGDCATLAHAADPSNGVRRIARIPHSMWLKFDFIFVSMAYSPSEYVNDEFYILIFVYCLSLPIKTSQNFINVGLKRSTGKWKHMTSIRKHDEKNLFECLFLYGSLLHVYVNECIWEK